MDIKVRLEEEKDYRRVEEITRAAFCYPDRIKRGQIGCPYEHWMVYKLRHRDGIMVLSFVAELEAAEDKTVHFFNNYIVPTIQKADIVSVRFRSYLHHHRRTRTILLPCL